MCVWFQFLFQQKINNNLHFFFNLKEKQTCLSFFFFLLSTNLWKLVGRDAGIVGCGMSIILVGHDDDRYAPDRIPCAPKDPLFLGVYETIKCLWLESF